MTTRAAGVLRRRLREVRLARQAVIRLRLLAQRRVASDGVIFLFYHEMKAGECHRFARQLRRLRNFGDLTSLSDAVSSLRQTTKGERRICLTFDDGCRNAFDYALPILVEQSVPAAFFVVPGWLDEARNGIIGWEECRVLAQAGIEIGSHSLTHRRLGALQSCEVQREIEASKARIEAQLGLPCAHFACPWGQPGLDYQSHREPALARAAGYRTFFTTIAERAHAGGDVWCLPRVRMEPGWSDAELDYALLR